LAEAYFKAGNKEEALKAVVKSLEISLNQQAAYDLIGKIFENDWAEVTSYGSEAAKENARVGRMLRMYGYLMAESYSEVIALYEEIDSPGAQDYKATVYAALAYLKTGKESEAGRLINRIDLKRAKNAVLYADVARYYLARGDKNKAREIALQGIEADENYKENYFVLMEIEKGNAAMVAYYGFMLVTRVPESVTKALAYVTENGVQLPSETLGKAYAKMIATSLINAYLQIAKDIMNDKTPYYTDNQIHTLLNRRYEAIMGPPVLNKWKEWVARGHWNSDYYASRYFLEADEEIISVSISESTSGSIAGHAIVLNDKFSINPMTYSMNPLNIFTLYKITNVTQKEFMSIIDTWDNPPFSGEYKKRYDFTLTKDDRSWFLKELKPSYAESKITSVRINNEEISIAEVLEGIKKSQPIERKTNTLMDENLTKTIGNPVVISYSIDNYDRITASLPNNSSINLKLGQEILLIGDEDGLIGPNGKARILINGLKLEFVSSERDKDFRIRAIANIVDKYSSYDISIVPHASGWSKALQYRVNITE
jgi:tetratricopeptide (TPR) repeat protein